MASLSRRRPDRSAINISIDATSASVGIPADSGGTTILVLHNFHRFLASPEIVQAVFTQLIAGKQQRTFLVVLAPTAQIPIELEKHFVVIEHALPDRNQLERIARELTSDHPEDLPEGVELQRVLDAATGLTRFEAEGALSLSLMLVDRPRRVLIRHRPTEGGAA